MPRGGFTGCFRGRCDKAVHSRARNMVWSHQQTDAHQRQLLQELGREPSAEELAKRLEVDVENVRTTRKVAQQPVSPGTPIGKDGESDLGDILEDKALRVAVTCINLDQWAHEETERTVASMLNCLQRARPIIRMRLCLDNDSEWHAGGSGTYVRRYARAAFARSEATVLRKTPPSVAVGHFRTLQNSL